MKQTCFLFFLLFSLISCDAPNQPQFAFTVGTVSVENEVQNLWFWIEPESKESSSGLVVTLHDPSDSMVAINSFLDPGLGSETYGELTDSGLYKVVARQNNVETERFIELDLEKTLAPAQNLVVDTSGYTPKVSWDFDENVVDYTLYVFTDSGERTNILGSAGSRLSPVINLNRLLQGNLGKLVLHDESFEVNLPNNLDAGNYYVEVTLFSDRRYTYFSPYRRYLNLKDDDVLSRIVNLSVTRSPVFTVE